MAKTMRAAQVKEHGGPEQIEIVELPIPEPGPGEVRVQVRAAALNHLDLWVRRGIPGHPFPLPIIPCGDVAGTVDANGPGASLHEPGARVVLNPSLCCGACRNCVSGDQHFCPKGGLLGESADGGAAEYIVVPERNVVPLPDGLSFEQGAALPVTFITAWTMAHRCARLKAGETVLIQAGGSGVGVALIAICKLIGVRILATAGGPEKVARLEAMGVDRAIDYKAEDVVAAVRETVGRQGVAVVFDHVGYDTWETSMRCLAWRGRIVLCGATTGFQVPLDLRRIFFKSQQVLGATMGSMGDFHRVVELAGQGRLAPVIDRTFPLAELRAAQEHLEARKAFGKVVISVE